MYAIAILGIPVEAWLAYDEITLFLIANDHRCEKPAFFL
jgi:hypothetical protein